MARTMRNLSASAALLCLSAAAVASIAAQPMIDLKDVAGSKDPAGIKRYDGSIIIGYKFEKFGEFSFLLGPLTPAADGSGRAPSKSQRVEGQRTRLLYTAPVGRSSLEVIRNYEQELVKAGFATMYQCAAAQCGDSDLAGHHLWTMENRLSNYPPSGSGRAPGQVTAYAYSSATDQRFLAAHRSGAAGDAWVSVYVALGAFDMHAETNNHPIVLVDLVEPTPMEGKMVTVDASAMAKSIASTGHVALYGIYFDFNKWDVKPESEPTLTQIAQLLKTTPAIKLMVVGHTDNVGGFAFNMDLSQRRATAVATALTTRFGIAKERLMPVGVSFASPIASNATDDGRGRNRRVELVEQAP